jgi:glyoxylase-like metal-dependent hydrolase (beta-lactamase superfamily II)
MKLYALECGHLTGPFRGEGGGDIRIPVPCYLFDHPRGKALVDTGLHPGMRDDPHARIGRVADLLRSELPDGADVASRLHALGTDPGELRYLVNTHMHFDHAGGNELIPEHVELVVQAREWAAANDSAGIEANHFNPADYGQPRPVREVDGEHDLYGDGSVVLLPTPGHTSGHQSLRVRVDDGELVLCADGCYFADWIDSEQTSPFGSDKEQEIESLRALRALRDGGARMIFGHDPEQWEALPKAPAALAESKLAA